MRIGRLRQRVTIQDRTVSRNSFNEEVETWAEVATVWARIESLSGTEFVATEQAGATVTHQITIRQRAGLLPTMRVLYGDHVFGVTAVLDDLESHTTRLMCFEMITEPERT